MEYNCPYCNTDSYAKSSRQKGKKFESWVPVQGHVAKCLYNNKEYFIDELAGPIHYSTIIDKDTKSLPIQIKSKFKHIVGVFKKRNINTGNHVNTYSIEYLLSCIKEFYKLHNRIPSYIEFQNNKPGSGVYQYRFGSWNNAIKAAGFEPNYNDGFGTRTYSKDGILYRSQAEAYFVDNYLYGKYTYEYERKYDNHNKYYDFYIKELNLYIELDGNCRPEIILDKIIINKQENKNLIVIKTNDIYKKDFKINNAGMV